MYKIEKISKLEKIEKHLTFPSTEIDEYSNWQYNPEKFWKNIPPKELERISEQNLKELQETGETVFSYQETITVKVKTV